MLKSYVHRLYDRLLDLYESSHWKDTRMWGFIAFAVVVLVASWSGVRVIETNYELQKKIARIRQQNEVVKLQNENQRLKNQYLETDTYLELSAREQFGKAAPGEKVIIIPESVAFAHAKEIPTQLKTEQMEAEQREHAPRYLKNLRAWRDFVFSHKLESAE